MQSAADEVCDTLKLLSNRNRLMILCQLTDGEMCVGDLAEQLGLNQVTVSQQLGILRNTGIVQSRRDAQTIFYAIHNKDVSKLVAILYRTLVPTPKNRRNKR